MQPSRSTPRSRPCSDPRPRRRSHDPGSCSSRIVLNADAESKGAELELFARASDNWDFGISATYVEAEITKSRLTPTGQTLKIGSPVSVVFVPAG